MEQGPMEDAYLRFLSGEMDAFDSIMTEYQAPLIRFIARYVGSASVAEDLAEDVFVEILLHRERYNFKVKLKTYLFTIARNRAIDYIRKNKRIVPYEVDEDLVPSAELMASPEDHILAREQKERILELIRSVKDDQGTALYLTLVEGLSNEETARIMKKSKKQIENLVFQGKRKLRLMIEKEGILTRKHPNNSARVFIINTPWNWRGSTKSSTSVFCSYSVPPPQRLL